MMRAAVFGVLGVLVVAPAAHAATCNHAGGVNGTTTLTFAPADGTVTLAADDTGALTFAVGAGAPVRLHRSRHRHQHAAGERGRQHRRRHARPRLHGRPLRARGRHADAIDAALGAGADALDVRLPEDDNTVFAGTLGADLDGDAAPDLTWSATERLALTGEHGRRRPRVRRRRRGLGDPSTSR